MSSMKSHINQNVDLEKWKDFYLKNEFKNIFQSFQFHTYINTVPDHKAFVFAIEDDGIYLALMVVTLQKEKGLKGYFSRRAICYGGPLLNEKNKEACKALLRLAKNYIKNKAIYFEVRNSNDYINYREYYCSENFSYIPYLNVKLQTRGRGLEDVLKKMKYNRRRQIRLSQERNAELKIADKSREVYALYSILERLYKTRVKVPLPRFEYFKKLFNSEFGKVFIVTHDLKIIGGAFCFHDADTIYTIYYCGERSYNSKIYPTHLAILGVIEFALSNNINCVDFMGAGRAGEEYGVRNYKLEFGGDLIEHGRYLYISNKMMYMLGKWGLNFLKVISK